MGDFYCLQKEYPLESLLVFWEHSYKGSIENLRIFIYKLPVRSVVRYLAHLEQSSVSFTVSSTTS